jgi:hypothetical protein
VPRKKSVKHSAHEFRDAVDDILAFVATVSRGQSDEHISLLHNYAVILLYREFEAMMLDALVGAVNNDTETIAKATGIDFPKHLTDEVCEFLITGTGYFDFKGRDGLIKTIKSFVPDTHYLLVEVKKPKYKDNIELLCALRNFATHGSDQSKRAVLKALGLERISSSGAWLKKQDRLTRLGESLKDLARDIETAAPY